MTPKPKRKRRWLMGLLIAAGALLLGFGTAYVASDNVRYLTRAGIEETSILLDRVPMKIVATDSAYSLRIRDAAKLVVEARHYATDIGLDAGQTYTTYSDVGRDTLLLVLTVSKRDCLCPITWSYPFVGRVPYRGYFDPEQGREAARKYAKEGYDVNLRPSAAFSTLGWFNDPLLSTAVGNDPVELAALVFHEIAHNTLWVKDATDFNESFAQWVGYRAAQQFFLSRGDTALSVRAGDRWHDEGLMGQYYDVLVAKLDTLYASHPSEAALDAGRDSVAAWARDTLASPFGQALRTIDPTRLGARPINNATLIGVRLYRTNLDLLDDWWWHHDRQLAVAVFSLRELMTDARGEQAWQRLRAMLDRPAENEAPPRTD